MKQWTSAEVSGQCAFCGGVWKPAVRIGLVQSDAGAWSKRYCGVCFQSQHKMPPDDGQITDHTDAPNYPKPLKALAERVLEEHPLMQGPAFEEPEAFDGRAAQLPTGDRD